MTPLKAIRIKCLDCCESAYEVKQCPVTTCALYPFRHGKNPNRAGITNGGSFHSKNNGSNRYSGSEITSDGNYITMAHDSNLSGFSQKENV